jgi:2-C-methyl-D-erythritol 2,4-cyclodiphosphate synthase
VTGEDGGARARASGGAPVRVGVGYDSHRFAPAGDPGGRPLVVAGVRMPGEARVVAHSDGDVAAHALTDAVLGAAALGDIGELFPNTDAANAGRDSIEMLRLAVERVRAAGWVVANADVAVVAERHKVGPHRAAMRERLAGALAVGADAVFVKGKTDEGLGALGAGDGLAAHAVVALVRAPSRDAYDA